MNTKGCDRTQQPAYEGKPAAVFMESIVPRIRGRHGEKLQLRKEVFQDIPGVNAFIDPDDRISRTGGGRGIFADVGCGHIGIFSAFRIEGYGDGR